MPSSARWLYFDTPLHDPEKGGAWVAFRASDQAKIDYAADHSREDEVGVKGQRWAVHLSRRTLEPRYWDAEPGEPPVAVRRCRWSFKDGAVWKPISTEADEACIDEALEAFKQRREQVGGTGASFTLELPTLVVSFALETSGAVSVSAKKQGGIASFLSMVPGIPLARGWKGDVEEDNGW